jgi:hypothetical protein
MMTVTQRPELDGYYKCISNFKKSFFKGSERVMIQAIVLFILAGIAEIGGGYIIWQWLRDGKPSYWGLIGGLVLALYGVISVLSILSIFRTGLRSLRRSIHRTLYLMGLGN